MKNICAGLFLACMAPLAGYADEPELPDPLEAGWQGEPVCEKLHEDDDQRILRCTFPLGYAISGGRVRIVDASGTRELSLDTGSSYSSDGVAWHEIENIGDTTIVYLIVEPK